MRPFATSVLLRATWMKMKTRKSVGIRNVAIQNAFAAHLLEVLALDDGEKLRVHGYFSSSAVGA